MNHEFDHQIPTEDELRGIFKVLGDEVPDLIGKLTKILFGVKESEYFGKAVGNFYKELQAAGMNTEQAFRLTQQYMAYLNLGQAFKGMGRNMRTDEAEN